MNVIYNISIVLAVFAAMEAVAWLAHKYIMHGLLWRLHKDHHQPRPNGVFERNDLFFLIFAVPAIICFVLGYPEFSDAFWVGTGITLYGTAYFFVHDLFIHQRVKVFRNTESVYLRAIRRAHKVHHRRLGREEGECFGMLTAPLKYFKQPRKHGG